MKKFIIINQNDNVMIALEHVNKGDIINGIKVNEDIDKGHKIALCDIHINEKIIKYGYPIGIAIKEIKKGDWIHLHNLKTLLNTINEYHYEPVLKNLEKLKDKKVLAYLRDNDEIGIRNELWIIPTVGCVNGQAKELARLFNDNHPQITIDGVYAFPHPYGCSQMGDDHQNTKEALQNIVHHPNAGGVLVLGLGCENNQLKTFKETLGQYDSKRIKFLNTQDVEDEIETGLKLIEEIYDVMKNDQRTSVSLSKLKIGLKCGGSDGLSGLTANPLIGRIADYFISLGGTSVLTEIPEMFGAEMVLLKRCQNEEIYQKLVNCINDFKLYYQKNNQVIYENPSPGNKAGGISTLEDKSLGCVQKSGSSNVVDVLKYTDRIKHNGLNILSAPGNDLVATTALGMCGCQLVLFSTGRGTPFGSFIPVIKIATNTELAIKKANWIDFDSGKVDFHQFEQITNVFIEFIIEVVEGRKTKNEINNSREIAIFKTGVTL